MILRSLGQSLKDQKWTTIPIESVLLEPSVRRMQARVQTGATR